MNRPHFFNVTIGHLPVSHASSADAVYTFSDDLSFGTSCIDIAAHDNSRARIWREVAQSGDIQLNVNPRLLGDLLDCFEETTSDETRVWLCHRHLGLLSLWAICHVFFVSGRHRTKIFVKQVPDSLPTQPTLEALSAATAGEIALAPEDIASVSRLWAVFCKNDVRALISERMLLRQELRRLTFPAGLLSVMRSLFPYSDGTGASSISEFDQLILRGFDGTVFTHIAHAIDADILNTYGATIVRHRLHEWATLSQPWVEIKGAHGVDTWMFRRANHFSDAMSWSREVMVPKYWIGGMQCYSEQQQLRK